MADPQVDKREEIALQEVGHTDVSAVVARFLVFCFLAIVLCVSFAQIGSELGKDSADRTVLTAGELLPSKAELLEVLRAASPSDAVQRLAALNTRVQRDLSSFDNRLAEESMISRFLVPKVQGILSGWMGAGTEQVYVGRDGWLFFRPNLDYLTGRGFLEPEVLLEGSRSGGEWESRRQPDPLPAILEFRDQLAARGVQLILVPMPTKAAIYPERFSDRYADDAEIVRNSSWAEFTARLAEAGVLYFDPATALHAGKRAAGQPLYLQTDTHWSPQGMALVAKDLARFVASHGELAPVSPPRYERVQRFVDNFGDVSVMLSPTRGDDHGAERRAPTSLYGSALRGSSLTVQQRVAIERIQSADGAPWRPDRGADVLLLSDSYGNIFSMPELGWGESAGLAEHLSIELGRPLDAIRINDNGSHITRQSLSRELQRGSDRLAGKRLLIWEFSERELAAGNWKTGLSLALGERASASTSTAASRVRARVAKISRPPRPGTVPYRDCVIALHLTDVRGLGFDADEALVFVWGMRDNVWTEAAELRPGQRVEIEARQWRAVQPEFGSYNRIELDDDELLALDPYWTESIRVLESGASQPMESEGPSPPDAALEAPAAATGPVSSDFLAGLAARASEFEAAGKTALRGEEGWLFFAPELRHLAGGPFWGEHATTRSRAANLEHADPLAAIVDFHSQLERAGIELLLVPVPAKAAIYHDKLPASLRAERVTAGERIDAGNREFFALLAERGVAVLDPTDAMLQQRGGGGAALYCKQDTHWSPAACELTARLIADVVRDRAWLQVVERSEYSLEHRSIELVGDLAADLADSSLPSESIAMGVVGTMESGVLRPIPPWRESPVLLLGDSHNLVFHSGGDMHARGGGLADHLAHELGFPVDLVAVRGSGANAARISLLRRRDELAGKKLVIWCFAARELTESEDGWRKVPVIR